MIEINFDDLKEMEIKSLGKSLKAKIKENGVSTKDISVTTESHYYGSDIWVNTNREVTEEEQKIIKEICNLYSNIVTVSLNCSACYYRHTEQYKKEEEIKYKEYLKKEEERQKKLEENKKIQEEEYNTNVKIDSIKNFNTKNIEEKNIFVTAAEPSINKNNWKTDNDKYINQECTLTKYKITDVVELQEEEYNYLCYNLLNDYEFLKGKGGSCYDNKTNKCLYNYAVAIVCKGKETLIIDPQGYSYARYTCRLIEDINNKLENEIDEKNTIKDTVIKEEFNKIIDTDLYIVSDSLWSYFTKKIKNDERLIYNIQDSNTYVTGYALKEMIKEGNNVKFPLQKSKLNIESIIKQLFDFINGNIQIFFPTEDQKQLLQINFLDRLKQELERIPKNPEPTKPTKFKTEENKKQNTNNTNIISLESYKKSPCLKSKMKLEGNATKKQLYALYCITKIKTTDLNISKELASDLISKAKKGKDIKEELKTLLKQDLKVINK